MTATTATSAISQFDLKRPTPTAISGYLPRSKAMPASFLIPTFFCGLSYAVGGIARVTDLGFLLLTIVCLGWLLEEIIRFPRRFGVGGLMLHGGVLIWFCYDYFDTWFMLPESSLLYQDISPRVVAKAALYHSLFVMLMAVGLMITKGQWLVKLMQSVPEPRNRNFLLALVIVLFVLGLSPYVLFTRGSAWEAIYRSMVGGRYGGASWTLGRSGALNYNWGGYVIELIKLGRIGAVLAVIYAVLVAKGPISKTIGWAIWAFWLAMAFGGGTRGHVAVVAVPAIFVVYLKFQSRAAARGKPLSIYAYLGAGALGLLTLVLIQIQAEYRNKGFQGVSVTEASTELEGNRMFSEGLKGWAVVPEHTPFISSRFFGDGAMRAIPETVFWIVIHPVPRALWRDKPIDPLWEWYNSIMVGKGSEGTTVSKGLVGSWYFRYGTLGMIQGALLMGWLIVCAERTLQHAHGRIMTILVSLVLLTWLFRCFRDFAVAEFWEFGVAVLFLWVVLKAYNRVGG